MILDFELNDKIYERLESIAEERGVDIRELIRWVIGDYMQYNVPRSISYPVPITPSPAEQESAKVIKLSGLFMKSMINQGAIKCPNCTLPLGIEDFEQGKCSKCESPI